MTNMRKATVENFRNLPSLAHIVKYIVILEIYFRDNAPALAKRQRGLRTIDSAILSLLYEMDDIRIPRMRIKMERNEKKLNVKL